MKVILWSIMQSFSWWDQKSTMSSLVPYRDCSVSLESLDMLKAPSDRLEKAVLISALMTCPLGW